VNVCSHSLVHGSDRGAGHFAVEETCVTLDRAGRSFLSGQFARFFVIEDPKTHAPQDGALGTLRGTAK
jgi:hypothetical protein